MIVALALAGCGRTVTRTDPETVTDLSGWWNDTDARMVADSMVEDCLEGSWLANWVGASRGDRPVIVEPSAAPPSALLLAAPDRPTIVGSMAIGNKASAVSTTSRTRCPSSSRRAPSSRPVASAARRPP